MTLKVILERVFEIVFDQYINLRVVFFFWKHKKSILLTKKNFAANFFRSLFGHQCFFDETLTIFSVVWLCPFAWNTYDGIWKKKKFAKFKVFQKLCEIFDIFEILYKYSLFQIE